MCFKVSFCYYSVLFCFLASVFLIAACSIKYYRKKCHNIIFKDVKNINSYKLQWIHVKGLERTRRTTKLVLKEYQRMIYIISELTKTVLTFLLALLNFRQVSYCLPLPSLPFPLSFLSAEVPNLPTMDQSVAC